MGLAQTARDRQRATIGGRANPFQNDDPLGKAFADSVEKGAGDAVKGVMDWWERSSADQEGVGDDLLRLVAGGVRNTTKAWQDATAEQEGITDDILRGVGWTAGKGMQVLDAGSYYGGQIGGNIARAVGVDARIGGALGNVAGDVLAGGAVKRAFQVGKLTSQMQRLQRAGYGLEVEQAFRIGRGEAASFAFGDFESRSRGIIDALTSNKKTRQLISNTEKGAELQQLILAHQRILQDVPETIIEGRKVKIWPGTEDDLIKNARRMITLKEDLGIKSPKSYAEELGAFVKDGYVARITGGHKGSTKVGRFQSRKAAVERFMREEIWPGDETFQKARRAVSSAEGAPQKHHFRILETSRPFAMVEDGKGGFKLRDPKQLERVSERLQKESNIFLGNQDRNELFQSIDAHIKGDLGSHPQLINATDIQRPGTYAEANMIEVLLKGDTEPTWVRQVRYNEADDLLKNPYLTTKDGTRIKASDVVEKRRYRINNRTYAEGQMHGFSEELQKNLASIKSDDELYDSIKLYYEITDEPLKGAAAIASTIYDKSKQVDDLSIKLRNSFDPEMVKWAETLLALPQYKNNRRLKSLLVKHQRARSSAKGLKQKLKIK